MKKSILFAVLFVMVLASVAAVLESGWTRTTNPATARTALNVPGLTNNNSYATTSSNNIPVLNVGTISSTNDYSIDNVKHPKWGAKGDGVTDDTAAIQAKIYDATNSTSSGVVEFPDGIYKVTTLNLEGMQYVTLRGTALATKSILQSTVDGSPIISAIDASYLTFENLEIESVNGLASCALLMGRSSDGTSGGNSVFNRLCILGSYRIAGIYTLASELNVWQNCMFRNNVVSTNAAFYSAKNATNIVGNPITSPFQTLSSTGTGGNGFNTFNECQFNNNSTNAQSINLVLEYGQATTLNSPYFYSEKATNMIWLGKNCIGLTINSMRQEYVTTQPTAMYFGTADTFRDIRITGSALFELVATNGSTISGLTMENSHWAGLHHTSIMFDVDTLKDAWINMSPASVPAGRAATNEYYRVRTLASRCQFLNIPSSRLLLLAPDSQTIFGGANFQYPVGFGPGITNPLIALEVQKSVAAGDDLVAVGSDAVGNTVRVVSQGPSGSTYAALASGVINIGAAASGDQANSIYARGGAVLALSVGNVSIGNADNVAKLNVTGDIRSSTTTTSTNGFSSDGVNFSKPPTNAPTDAYVWTATGTAGYGKWAAAGGGVAQTNISYTAVTNAPWGLLGGTNIWTGTNTFGTMIIDTLLLTTPNGNFWTNLTGDPTAYGASWDGNTNVPTKNSVYDKIETLGGGGGGTGNITNNNVSLVNGEVVFAGSATVVYSTNQSAARTALNVPGLTNDNIYASTSSNFFGGPVTVQSNAVFNSKIGVGTNAPTVAIHIVGASAASGIIQEIINNTTASGFSNLRLVNNTGKLVQFGLYGSTATAFGPIASGEGNLYTDSTGLSFIADNAAGSIKFATGGSGEDVRIMPNGYFAIGTTNADSLLSLSNNTAASLFKVSGAASANIFNVTSNGNATLSGGLSVTNTLKVAGVTTLDSTVLLTSLAGGVPAKMLTVVAATGQITQTAMNNGFEAIRANGDATGYDVWNTVTQRVDFVYATNGFASARSNLLAAATITVTASPFNWTNVQSCNVHVFVDGISVTGTTSINGGVVYNSIGQNLLPLAPGEYATITYTIGTPTATWRPSR